MKIFEVEMKQKTIRNEVSMRGVGIHTGQNVSITIKPAPVNHGIIFRRTDLGIDIPAISKYVSNTSFCTTLSHEEATISTVEHLLSALYALQICNVLVEIDGPEVPIFNGSSDYFVAMIKSKEQNALRNIFRVKEPIIVEHDVAFVGLFPSSLNKKDTLHLSVSINFSDSIIGYQKSEITLSPNTYCNNIAYARTFTALNDLHKLQKLNLIKGGTLDNAIVVDGDRVLNRENYMTDNFVKHKMLDAIGDLALFEDYIYGIYLAYKPSHALNNMLVKKLVESTNV